ncbi:hypothetical protein GW17_00012620 [Ensete ventricosum]|nr:hypothetical protein GW17_00012620 [Ensete ventricosum]
MREPRSRPFEILPPWLLLQILNNPGHRLLERDIEITGVTGYAKAPMQRSGRLRQGPLQRGDRLQQGPLQRGGRLRLGPARKGAAPARGQTARAAARGWSAAARRPQGAAAARGHAAGAAANSLQTVAHGQPARGDRLRVRRPQEGSLRAEASPARAAACKGGRQQR